MDVHFIYQKFLRYFRAKRKRLFYRLINPSPGWRILDVGGYHWFWHRMACRNPITCLNSNIPKLEGILPARFNYVQADGRSLPYGKDVFEIVFSNSVIEHLGNFEDQQRFAAEIRRVGKSYWVQTPNRWFPVEPHLIGLFIHYLPQRIQRRLIRWSTIWGIVTRPTQRKIDDFIFEVRLLTEVEMKALFPDAMILCESFFGLKKSLIAVKAIEDSRARLANDGHYHKN